jgi:LacI family transcriptional regulator
VLAYNDLIAIGMHEAMRLAGTDVPYGLSIVGIDDTQLAGAFNLSTVATPTAAAGVAAVDLLLQQGMPAWPGDGEQRPAVDASRRTNTQVILPTTLITRQSTGPGPFARPARNGRVTGRPVPSRP